MKFRFSIRQLLVVVSIASLILGLNSLVASRSRAFNIALEQNPSPVIQRHTENVPDTLTPGIINETTLMDQFCLRRRTTVQFRKEWTRGDGGFTTEYRKMTFVTTLVGTNFISEDGTSLPTVTMYN